MRFKFTGEQDRLRGEIGDFFREELNDEKMDRLEANGDLASGYSPVLHKKMAEKGWLAMGWPKEYGGKGWTHMEMAIFNEEAGYWRAPMDAYQVTSFVSNTIIALGNEEQRKKYLPKVAAGDLICSIGYTEPNAGSDLASLETRAVQDGDEYVVNGVKIFNSAGHVAQYCWLATRTDPKAPKHKGISVFLVDLKSPGISIRPLYNVADGYQQNEVIFQDVRVPRENMVGEKNRGWYVIAKALDIERSGTGGAGNCRRTLEEIIRYCKETTRNGVPLSKDPVVRQKIANLAIETEVLRLIAYEVAWMQTNGHIPDVLASMSKLYGSELSQRMAHVGLQIMGPRGLVHGSSKWAAMRGRLELMVRGTIMATVAGGTSEIQRGVIAMRGLGMPRA